MRLYHQSAHRARAGRVRGPQQIGSASHGHSERVSVCTSEEIEHTARCYPLGVQARLAAYLEELRPHIRSMGLSWDRDNSAAHRPSHAGTLILLLQENSIRCRRNILMPRSHVDAFMRPRVDRVQGLPFGPALLGSGCVAYSLSTSRYDFTRAAWTSPPSLVVIG